LVFPTKLLRPIALAAFLALTLGAQAPAPEPSDSLFGEIDQIMADLSAISGLTPLAPVHCQRIPKNKVKPFLEQRVKEVVKPEEIRAEEAALKKLGFVPPDFNLEKTTLDLLSEQAAAFYDFRKKKLFMIDSDAGAVQHSALVHELAHALADQHFHLEKFIDHAGKNDDSSLARLAVMEGQATWLMSEYLTRRTGQSLQDSPALVKMMSRVGEASSGEFPVFDRAPLYLRETLLFPYTQGMLFQHAVVEKMGKAAFGEVFRRPPSNTQQILHPDKYFESVKAPRPELPALTTHRSYRGFTDGEVGELDHAILLRQYAGDEAAAAIAPEWRGGFFRLLESRTGGKRSAIPARTVLVYASEWSGPEQALRFFGLYQKVLAGKWKRYEVESNAGDTVSGRGDDGYFLLRRQGSRVSSIEGLASLEEARQSGGSASRSAAASQPQLVPAIH
jgi:hypothetical protein